MMASERIFTDLHLPGGLRLATNPSNTEEENSVLDKLFSELADVSGERDIMLQMLDIQEKQIEALKEKSARAADDKPPSERDTSRMKNSDDYRHELHLRDEQLRREIEMRQDSSRSEQALRDKAWDDRYAGFLVAQAERDKRLDDSIEGIRGDLSKLGSLKANIWGAMATAIGIILAVAALSLTFYQTGKSDSAPAGGSSQVQQSAPKQ
jgi:hypothetical protein